MTLPLLEDLGNFFGITRNKQQQALQAQYARMAEAYRQQRLFAADANQRRLYSQVQLAKPLQQLTGSITGLQQADTNAALDQFGLAVQKIQNMSNVSKEQNDEKQKQLMLKWLADVKAQNEQKSFLGKGKSPFDLQSSKDATEFGNKRIV